jgi:hypothetical protein
LAVIIELQAFILLFRQVNLEPYPEVEPAIAVGIMNAGMPVAHERFHGHIAVDKNRQPGA